MTTIQHFWQQYLQTLFPSTDANQSYLVEQFGDTPELANRLGHLILEGNKTATCSVLWEWEAEQSPLPTVGAKTIVLDGNEIPICIIETVEVNIYPFDQVNAQFAYDEGEDDRTLESWRQEHWKYFSRVLAKIGKEPTLNMPLVCERFQIVYRTPKRQP
ncbi:ASCH domain-containing protein [Acaryochloris marina]|uniref:ASCH domain-containing protein n=1 Tax=Acaryochloris marina TaxID=155978 RepID=UPI0021C3DAE2|nr:ASCH domain-containing protein [Acaryochloris marina]